MARWSCSASQKACPSSSEELKKYQDVLQDLADLDVATAGYVDRPRGDLVVRLLELVILQRRGQLNKAGEERPLRGVYDYLPVCVSC